jgi:hypothetical protein
LAVIDEQSAAAPMGLDCAVPLAVVRCPRDPPNLETADRPAALRTADDEMLKRFTDRLANKDAPTAKPAALYCGRLHPNTRNQMLAADVRPTIRTG